MTDESRTQAPESAAQPQEYEAPRVEDVPSEDGPAVTAAGKSLPVGAEWQPGAGKSQVTH